MGDSDHEEVLLHIMMIPFMASGHQIPMFDLAKVLLSKTNVKLSMATTTHNMVRFCDHMGGVNYTQSCIDLHVLDFQPEAYGLPPGAENFDMIGRDMIGKFLNAVMNLQPQTDEIVRKHKPDAIISDLFMPFTYNIASKYGIPRVGLHVSSCFAKVVSDGVMDLLFGSGTGPAALTNYEERFLVPGLPDEVYVTMDQTPSRFFKNMEATEFLMEAIQAEMNTPFIIYNTFREMEHVYLDFYQRTCEKKVWTLGPLLLLNKDKDKEEITDRGKASTMDRNECISWLDSQEAQSVIYVAFGSLAIISKAQLLEIGLGLEASNVPFIWAVREANKVVGPEMTSLEERVKGRGLIIKGWAPQAMILAHPSTGGFLTHCGWNSTLEGICLGKPMLTWPLFGEQFYTQTFVSERLRIGFGIGVDTGMEWGTEEKLGAQVTRDHVAMQVTRLMKGDDAPEMRRRAGELSQLAKEAVTEGGSSSRDLDGFIGELLELKAKRE